MNRVVRPASSADDDEGEGFAGFAVFGDIPEHVANVRCPWCGQIVAMLWRDTALGSDDHLRFVTESQFDAFAGAQADADAEDYVVDVMSTPAWCHEGSHRWVLNRRDWEAAERFNDVGSGPLNLRAHKPPENRTVRQGELLPQHRHMACMATVRCPWCGAAVMEFWRDGTDDALVEVYSSDAANEYWWRLLGDYYAPEVWCDRAADHPWFLPDRERGRLPRVWDGEHMNLRARRSTKPG